MCLPQSIIPSCTISRHQVETRRMTHSAWRAQTAWRPASPPATLHVPQKGERLDNEQLALFPWEHSSLPRLPGEGSLRFVPVTTCFVTCVLLWLLVHWLLPCQRLKVFVRVFVKVQSLSFGYWWSRRNLCLHLLLLSVSGFQACLFTVFNPSFVIAVSSDAPFLCVL